MTVVQVSCALCLRCRFDPLATSLLHDRGTIEPLPSGNFSLQFFAALRPGKFSYWIAPALSFPSVFLLSPRYPHFLSFRASSLKFRPIIEVLFPSLPRPICLPASAFLELFHFLMPLPIIRRVFAPKRYPSLRRLTNFEYKSFGTRNAMVALAFVSFSSK